MWQRYWLGWWSFTGVRFSYFSSTVHLHTHPHSRIPLLNWGSWLRRLHARDWMTTSSSRCKESLWTRIIMGDGWPWGTTKSRLGIPCFWWRLDFPWKSQTHRWGGSYNEYYNDSAICWNPKLYSSIWILVPVPVSTLSHLVTLTAMTVHYAGTKPANEYYLL